MSLPNSVIIKEKKTRTWWTNLRLHGGFVDDMAFVHHLLCQEESRQNVIRSSLNSFGSSSFDSQSQKPELQSYKVVPDMQQSCDSIEEDGNRIIFDVEPDFKIKNENDCSSDSDVNDNATPVQQNSTIQLLQSALKSNSNKTLAKSSSFVFTHCECVKLACSQFTLKERQGVNKEFTNLGDCASRSAYIRRFARPVTKPAGLGTFRFSLAKRRVCQQVFLGTLNITEGEFSTFVAKNENITKHDMEKNMPPSDVVECTLRPDSQISNSVEGVVANCGFNIADQSKMCNTMLFAGSSSDAIDSVMVGSNGKRLNEETANKESPNKKKKIEDSTVEAENSYKMREALYEKQSKERLIKAMALGKKSKTELKRGEQKYRRLMGLPYLTRYNVEKPGKTFQTVECLCKNMECKKLPLEQRRAVFEAFYMMGDLAKQNQFIHQSMEVKWNRNAKVREAHGCQPGKEVRKYMMAGLHVCREVFLGTLGISCGKIVSALGGSKLYPD